MAANRLDAVITQVFPDEYHLHTLDQILSAIARLNPHVNVKVIVIALMDRISTYAARESQAKNPEEKQEIEERAMTQLLEKMKLSKQTKEGEDSKSGQEDVGTEQAQQGNGESRAESTDEASTDKAEDVNGDSKPSGLPENIKLFEIFHEQVMNLVNAQRLPIQDTIALLVSLANLAL